MKGSKDKYALKVERMIREAGNVYFYECTRLDDHGILIRKIARFAGTRKDFEQTGELGRLVDGAIDCEGQPLGTVGIDREVEA